MDEGAIYLIGFIIFIWWIIKTDDKNKQPAKTTRAGTNDKDHLRYITAREVFKQKTNRYPDMNKEADVIEFIKCYNTENQNQRAGGYQPQKPPYYGPPQQPYYDPNNQQ